MYNTSIDIEAATREAVIGILHPALSDAVNLLTQIKQAHLQAGG